MANTLDELMRDAHKVLKGPHDRRIEDIITYMRQDRARQDAGKKPRRSHVSDEEMSPRIMEAFRKMLPQKKVYRRF
jgi:hypothetical protein